MARAAHPQHGDAATGCHRGRAAPADALPGEDVDDRAMGTPLAREIMARGHIDHALPAWDIGEIRNPEPVRHVCHAGPAHLVVRARLGRIGGGRDDLPAAHNAAAIAMPLFCPFPLRVADTGVFFGRKITRDGRMYHFDLVPSKGKPPYTAAILRVFGFFIVQLILQATSPERLAGLRAARRPPRPAAPALSRCRPSRRPRPIWSGRLPMPNGGSSSNDGGVSPYQFRHS